MWFCVKQGFLQSVRKAGAGRRDQLPCCLPPEKLQTLVTEELLPLTSSSGLCSLPSAVFEASFWSNWPWERSSTNSELLVDDVGPRPYGTSGWGSLKSRRQKHKSSVSKSPTHHGSKQISLLAKAHASPWINSPTLFCIKVNCLQSNYRTFKKSGFSAWLNQGSSTKKSPTKNNHILSPKYYLSPQHRLHILVLSMQQSVTFICYL